MKILTAKVDWCLTYDNPPRLMVLVDTMPLRDPLHDVFRYEERNNIYRAEHDGFVRYFHHDLGDQTGFGGHVFNITMTDGTRRSLKGPWSSRAACINAAFPDREACVDLSYVDNFKEYNQGYTFYAGAFTLTKAQEAADIAGAPLIRIPSRKEVGEKEWQSYLRPTKWCRFLITEYLDAGPSWEIGGKLRIDVKMPNDTYQWAAVRTNMYFPNRRVRAS